MDDLAERSGVTRGDATPPASARRRIVIIGAGFGGLSAAQRLARVAADIIVIDRRNHHLFQPLLYQVATAALSPADIAAPIRGILSRQRNTVVILGTMTGIDVAGRTVLLGDRRVPYDQLVIATGARESYFGHDDWSAVTSGLKSIEDATAMRHRILVAFERAEDSEDEAEQRRLLTFVIIGGGPTGSSWPAPWQSWQRRRSPATFAISTRLPHASCWSRPVLGCYRAFRRIYPRRQPERCRGWAWRYGSASQ